jgi:hypothetical protein
MWMYVGFALRHLGAARRINLTFIFEFSIQAQRLVVLAKLWYNTTEIENVPPTETAIL